MPRRKPIPQSQRKQPTHVERQEREEYAYYLLSAGLLTSQIKEQFRARFGPTHHVTIGRYLLRARERMLLAVREERAEQRCESLAYYRSVLADPKAPCRDRIKAREQMDKLLGLQLRLPPVEQLCEYLGVSRDELAAAVSAARRPVPGPDAPAGPPTPGALPGIPGPPG